ncbi:exported protein of unknown function [Cupriavidus taiwanensis]|nr:exported protein of unknown function [Cupriavidus taiwanensis]
MMHLHRSGFLIIITISAPQPTGNAGELKPKSNVIGRRTANLPSQSQIKITTETMVGQRS